MKIIKPKVFISYSWSSDSHIKWVLELCERLASNGIDPTIDKWDLKEGQDINHFIEQMSLDSLMRRVLIVCDKLYMEKANKRKGGVGKESQIISEEVYKQIDQRKFIPIIAEKNIDNEPYLPVFLKGRYYLDFSDPTIYDDEYEKLVRNIFDKPLDRKPKIGVPPAYILQENIRPISTAHKVNQIKTAFISNKEVSNFFVNEYFEIFLSEYQKVVIKAESTDEVHNKLYEFMTYRDDFVYFLDTISNFAYIENNIQKFSYFFTECLKLTMAPKGWNQWSHFWFDSIHYLNYELMLHFCALLLYKGKYNALADFIGEGFYYKDRSYNKMVSKNYIDFLPRACKSIGISSKYNEKINVTEIFNSNFNDQFINIEYFHAIDGLLFLRSYLDSKTGRIWYPLILTSEYDYGSGEIIEYLKVRKYFKNLSKIIGVTGKVDLNEKYQKANNEKPLESIFKNVEDYEYAAFFMDIIEESDSI